ncbi:hypothetical protein ACLOJK_005913 [Asimina triloba]
MLDARRHNQGRRVTRSSRVGQHGLCRVDSRGCRASPQSSFPFVSSRAVGRRRRHHPLFSIRQGCRASATPLSSFRQRHRCRQGCRQRSRHSHPLFPSFPLSLSLHALLCLSGLAVPSLPAHARARAREPSSSLSLAVPASPSYPSSSLIHRKSPFSKLPSALSRPTTPSSAPSSSPMPLLPSSQVAAALLVLSCSASPVPPPAHRLLPCSASPLASHHHCLACFASPSLVATWVAVTS